MSNRPVLHLPQSADNAAKTDNADTQVNPDHEYEDSTESKLDHSKPPHHDKTAADIKHKDEPQISVGKP
ncbi:hypothetical protein [Herbaspirillum sp. NPDC101396]|uniref:hypothetical protein n=1 Tax=Herbaspirillum sp. NPDC101396 TaxID=3364005 RepID=UPI00383BA217